ncbi:hypothetical protein COO91_08819 [Nostoc flagelliforme CCNUN1]|uniref:Uncharacterized protein n=1 Tax=Nostoc flagelliforme CCNUN1 TaxID=2038116 RepID=A0A2K8T519_9NOSO|nr:hypothetical protein COO91_08819 [Nostoc flagelliforme CCNUN1]
MDFGLGIGKEKAGGRKQKFFNFELISPSSPSSSPAPSSSHSLLPTPQLTTSLDNAQ